MSDKSNWKNKNRDILKGAIEGVKKNCCSFYKRSGWFRRGNKTFKRIKT